MAFYCAQCGGPLNGDARFCPACGTPVSGPVEAASGRAAPLVRPHAGRKIAGVCQALANRFGWDVVWVRVAAVVIAVLTIFPGIILYLILWLVVPEEAAIPNSTTPPGSAGIVNLDPH